MIFYVLALEREKVRDPLSYTFWSMQSLVRLLDRKARDENITLVAFTYYPHIPTVARISYAQQLIPRPFECCRAATVDAPENNWNAGMLLDHAEHFLEMLLNN